MMEFKRPLVRNSDVISILSAYDLGAVRSSKDRSGIPNTTYEVATETGVFALRVYSHGQSSRQHIELEIAVLQHLILHEFPVPVIIPGRNGQFLQSWSGYWVSLSRFIAGQTADIGGVTPGIAQSVGNLLALFRTAMDDFPVPAEEQFSFMSRGSETVQSVMNHAVRDDLPIDRQWLQRSWVEGTLRFQELSTRLPARVIHADIWPPNVICRDDRVISLIDYDDCCVSPAVVDVAIALMEFGMWQGASTLHRAMALALLTGYFKAGGAMNDLEESLLLPSMELVCAMWLAYEVIQAPILFEARAYWDRLRQFGDSRRRQWFEKSLRELVAEAKRNAQSITDP